MCSWGGLSICALVWDIWILLCDSIGSEGSRESSIIQTGRWIPEIAPCLQSVTNSSGSVTLTELQRAERTAEHIQIPSFYFDIAFVPTQSVPKSKVTVWSSSCRISKGNTFTLTVVEVTVSAQVVYIAYSLYLRSSVRPWACWSWGEVWSLKSKTSVCCFLKSRLFRQTDEPTHAC